MPNIADLTVSIGAETGELRKGYSDAAKDTQRFTKRASDSLEDFGRKSRRTTQRTQKQIERFRRQTVRDFKSLASGIRNAGAAFAAAFGVAAVTQTQFARQIQQTANATGLTTREVQVLGTTMQAFGKDMDEVNDLVIDWDDRLQELRDGTSSFVADFELLGLAARDFDGKNTIEQLQLISRAIAEADDQTAARAFAARIFPQAQAFIGEFGPAVDDFNKRLAATGGLIQGNLGGFQNLSNTMTLAAQTIRAQFINGLQDAAGAGENLDSTIAAAGVAVRKATEAIVGGVKFLFEYREAVLTVTAAITGLVIAAKTIGAIKTLAATISLAFSPVTLVVLGVVAAIAAIGAIAFVIVDQWDQVTGFFDNIGKALTARFKQVGVGIQFAFEGAILLARKAFNGFLGLISKGINFIIDAINTIQRFRGKEEFDRIDLSFDVSGAEERVAELKQRFNELGDEFQERTAAAMVNIVMGATDGVSNAIDKVKEIPGLVAKAVSSGVDAAAAAAPTASETDTVVRNNQRAVRSLDEIVMANDNTAISAIALSTATDTLRSRFGALSGTEAEVNQQLIERKQVLEELANADEAVIRAYNNITLAGQEFAEATSGLGAMQSQQVLDLTQVGLVPPEQLEQATEATSFALVESLRGSLSNAVSTGDFGQVGDAMFTNLRDTLSQGFVDRFANYLNDAFSKLLGGEGFGGFGLGNLFGGSFQRGGTVPGNRGDAVLIRAHAGERVLPVGQTGATINFNNTVTGDLARSTRRELIQLNREQQAAGFMAARANGGA